MLANRDVVGPTADRSEVLDGRYQVERTLHETREGTLLLAVESRLRRRVAIKVVEVGARTEAAARFSAVVQFLAGLEHPNCVHVIDTGTTPKGLPYAVMPFTEGTRLRDLIDRDALEPRRAATLAIAILRGLAHAHKRGCVHRDLKPDCVIVPPDRDGDARISDFWSASVPGWNERQVGVTLADLDVGTAEYSSPEQALGMEIDERSDLYAVGIILFEMLHGTPPFSGEDPFHVLQLQIHSPLPTLRADVPVALGRVVLKLTNKEPSERYGTANDALIDLEAFVATIDTAYADLTASLSSPLTARIASQPTDPLRSGGVAAITAAEIGDDLDRSAAPRSSSRAGLFFMLGAAALAVIAGGYAMSHRANTPSTDGPLPPDQVAGAAAALSTRTTAEMEPQRPVLGKTLSSLAIVNESRIENAAPYRERRALLAELEAEGHGEKIDQRLQIAMDLAQAAESPTPCRTFAAALAEIERVPGEDFTTALASARVPDDVPGAGRAPDGRCDGLSARLARARGEGGALASAEPVRVGKAAPHHAEKRRAKKSSRSTPDSDPPAAAPAPVAKPAPAAAPSPIAKVKDPPPIRKLDDGIKRL